MTGVAISEDSCTARHLKWVTKVSCGSLTRQGLTSSGRGCLNDVDQKTTVTFPSLASPTALPFYQRSLASAASRAQFKVKSFRLRNTAGFLNICKKRILPLKVIVETLREKQLRVTLRFEVNLLHPWIYCVLIVPRCIIDCSKPRKSKFGLRHNSKYCLVPPQSKSKAMQGDRATGQIIGTYTRYSKTCL